MCGLCVSVVEPRVQRGDTFLVSDTPLFSRVGLIPQIILFLPSDNFCAYVLQPGSLSAPLPMLLGASPCLSFQHPSETSSALLPQVPGRNWQAWDGQGAGINCGHTRNWLYVKNYPKAQTYVSNLCFNSQVGEKSKLQLIKKG